MNKNIKRVVVIFTVLCSIATIVNVAYDFLLPLYLSHKFNMDLRGASSIGIIGAADGPTSIFISSLNYPYLTTIFALMSMAGMAYLIITKRKKQ